MDSSPSFKKLLVRSLLLLGPSLVAAQGGNLASCLDSAGVPYILDSAPNWANETSPWQLRLKDDVSPAALAYPTDTDHIAACLACAEETKTKVSVLSGGHSFVAYGFGDPGNLVINMAAFNTCSYDAASETYTMGGGTRVGPAVKQLWEENQRHFAHVRHGRVGVVGASIGGGFGTTSRFLGTPMDNIAGAEIMLANGTIVDAKPGSDLLWAISGAGSSFGVIISLTTKTWQPAHANITTFTITLSPEQGPDGAASAVIAAQEMALAGEIPDELALRFQFSKKPGYNTLGYYYGDPKDFDSVIQPLMDKMPANTTIESESVEFFEAESTIAVGAKLPQGGTSPPRTFYIQSLTTTADHPLSLETVTLAFQRATVDFDRPDLKSSGFFDIYGGFSKNVKDSDHAHAIGNVLWFIRMDTNTMKNDDPWPVDGTSYGKSILLPFEEALTAANQPLRGFANYRDSELTEDQWSSRLYGENYGRLKEIKAAYDPTGMFTNNKQSIAPPVSSDSAPAYYPMTPISAAKNDPAPTEKNYDPSPSEYQTNPAKKEKEKKQKKQKKEKKKKEGKKEESTKEYKTEPVPKEEEEKKEEPAKQYKTEPAPKEEEEKKEEPAKQYKTEPAKKEEEKKEEPAKEYKAEPAKKEEEKKEEPVKEYKAEPAKKEEEKKEEPAKEYKAEPAKKEEEKKEEPAKEYKSEPVPKEEEKKKEEPAKGYKTQAPPAQSACPDPKAKTTY